MNNTLPALRKELQRWKGVSHVIERGSRHPKLILTIGETSRFVVFSTTKVEKRGLHNKVGDLRRTLRELGAERS